MEITAARVRDCEPGRETPAAHQNRGRFRAKKTENERQDDAIDAINDRKIMRDSSLTKDPLKNNLYKAVEVGYVLFSAELWSSSRCCDDCF